MQILGAAAKFILKTEYDCELSYRSLRWEEGKLVFSDLFLFDATFHSHVKKASFQFDWSSLPKQLKGHLILDSPHLSIREKKTFSPMQDHWLDLSVHVAQGILDWDGPVHFSLDHNSHRSQIAFDWEDSRALLTLREGKIRGELENFNLTLLKPWIPFAEISNGRITGHLALDCEGAPLSANLKIERLRADYLGGVVDDLEGTFSYHADLGAKWDLKGIGKAQEIFFPFTCQGRGFFKSGWMESNIDFENSWCRLSGFEVWAFECDQLRAEQATWLQFGLRALFPELEGWAFTNGVINGKGSFRSSSWSAVFRGENISIQKGPYLFTCESVNANLTQEGGDFDLLSPNCALQFSGTWRDWTAEAKIYSAELSLKGGWDGEKLPIQIEKGSFADLQFTGRGWLNTDLDLSFSLDGWWNLLEKAIPFYCPNLSKEGSLWSFDVRCMRKTWDISRLAGVYEAGLLSLSEKSHLLGAPLLFSPSSLEELDIVAELPWKAILSAGPFFNQLGLNINQLPQIEKTALRFQFIKGQVNLMAEGENPSFYLHAKQESGQWQIDLQSDLSLKATIKSDGSAKGRGNWKDLMYAEFNGKILPTLQCEFSLPKISAELALETPLKMNGQLEGQGHFTYNGQIESDFDLSVSSFVIQAHPLENQGPIHLCYSSEKGVLVSGLDLHGQFDCIVDLLEYDANSSHWIFHKAQVHLPGSFWTNPLLSFLDREKDLNFTADLNFSSDFATFSCKMSEGLLPYQGAYYQVENLDLLWNNGKCSASLYYQNHLHRIQLQIEETIKGRFILGSEETPLAIDWEYGDGFLIRSMEGSFGGVNASFHEETANVLVGSAHLNFTALSALLPVDVAQVFSEIKMGKGYELKGRLRIEKNKPSFKGLLSGKAIELFGFQFRTLLAQVDLRPECMRIYDLKISDSAGMMKIDELILQTKQDEPWTIAIPNLTLLEMRPSLLQRPEKTAGPMNPLVVREFKLTDFQGLLADGKTYTAKGRLHFINSYKRGETVFDLPANVLSRIVGLDLELLIPVTGDLSFDLKDGYFNLLELTHAYSEGRRSEFFLEMDPPPRMDLDGNLQIFIKMKQFVLLKITESLLISIDGALNDPKYQLKKKRFFGLI